MPKDKTDNFLQAIKKHAKTQKSAMQGEVKQLKNERLKAEAVTELTRLDTFIHTVEDVRARDILVQVYIMGHKQADVAIAMDLSYQRVSNIITETLKKY